VPSEIVTTLGLSTDRHHDTRDHGGPMRALCLWSLEAIEALSAEGHPIAPGAAGENVTTSGIDLARLHPGARLQLGADVEIEITSFTSPCRNIAPYFIDGEFTRISQKVHPGWSRVYARIISEGTISAGDPILLLDSGHEATAEAHARRNPGSGST
jgi:MOSC domain-containing protein YiiM